MNEQDFNEALHDVMTRSSPPPPMDPSRALERGRRARKRRRAVWIGAAVVPLVAVVGAGPVLIANYAEWPVGGSAGGGRHQHDAAGAHGDADRGADDAEDW